MTQIRECGRTIGGGIVVFDIEWDDELPRGPVAWRVTVANDDGSEHVALVHERSDNDFVAQYVEAEGGRQRVAEDATVEEGHVTARFPVKVVGVATQWPVWKAAMVIDGETVSEKVLPST